MTVSNSVSTVMGLVDAIEQRRAARSFKPDPIPEAVLMEILRLGLRAPSGYNLQPWRFLVLREAKHKEKLQACAFGQRQVAEAPVVLICCGDRRVNSREYVESIIQLGVDAGSMSDEYADVMRGAVPQLFDAQPSFETLEAWTNRHVMLAVAHLMVAAKGFGVDTCPMEGFATAQVKEAFQIPDQVDVCCLLPMGYADTPLKTYGGRFAIDQVCYEETFGKSLSD
ncbi:Nitroreductase [Halomicronema hongdechloris C2206]|uniref:Nitroreductase n=1 Tax=Halomicronema hongdechloris C2206 TaxID=1641165 RepID=A0A1Z3HLV8_9CYAN|nr:nitroreductase family protein [Halomicronema hongdechloris]ASC71284.1 Nitroreductase [Halomicronema hongdechloris C2206]